MITPHPVNPWIEEPELIKEGDCHSWNMMSPELEFCQYVQDQVAQLTTESKEAIWVVETGVGQGFVTRRILEVLRDKDEYWGYETDQYFLDLIPDKLYAQPGFYKGSPTVGVLQKADLVILDSEVNTRLTELSLWRREGKLGSQLIIHDVPEPLGFKSPLQSAVFKLGFPGHFLRNPRGGWHGEHL
jgi:hypothetical protein